jgi:hypothetical protein
MTDLCCQLQEEWRIEDLKLRQSQLGKDEPVIGFGGENPYQNVDLDTMHLDLYKGFYHSPESFLEEITWIEQNAEFEGDKETIVKAGQMTNHAGIMLDATFEPQFKIDCARMAERMVEREKLKPKVDKGKEKEIVDGLEIVVRATRTSGADLEMVGDVDMIERQLKRDRRESGADQGEDGNAFAGPSKRAKGMDDQAVDETEAEAEAEATAGAGAEGQSTGNHAVTSLDRLKSASLGPTSSADSFLVNATAASNLAGTFAALPSLPLPATSTAASNGHPPAILHSAPSTDSQNMPSVAAFESPATTLPIAIAAPVQIPSPIIVDPPTPEPLPDFVLPSGALARLSEFLVDRTARLNVDQLEQLRAACYDGIWRARKDWDRTSLIADLDLLSAEFVEEVEEMLDAMKELH